SSQRGVALLMVLGLLALLGTVIADFQYSSQVDVRLAYNARDELQAEYNALSALRVRALILKQARKVQALVNGSMQAMGGASGAAAPPIGAILDMIPVECGLLSAITKRIDRSATGPGAQEDFFPGECMATSESEHAKIAINLLANGLNQGAQTAVANMLRGTLFDPRLRKHFEQDDLMGQHAETPDILVNALADWVDADHNQQGSLGDEDRYYQYAREPYRAKNAPFDSVAELQLVYGVNDALYAALKNRVSVYSSEPTIELSTAPIETILLVGLPAILKDNVGYDVLQAALPVLAQKLAVMKQMSSFAPLSVHLFGGLLDASGLAGKYDPQRLQSQFTDRSSTVWYTILAQGSMGNATRKIRAVFQAMEGSFYYARVD
ncbi:MAG: hypothetical protein EOO40_07445, partial [Deltaproteobacteria bacterium]